MSELLKILLYVAIGILAITIVYICAYIGKSFYKKENEKLILQASQNNATLKKEDLVSTKIKDENIKQDNVAEKEQISSLENKNLENENNEKQEKNEKIEAKKQINEEDELVIGDALSESEDSDEEEKEKKEIKRIPFSVKLLSLEQNVQSYFDALYNELYSYKNVHPRISQKCVSFRNGRKLIAKLAIRGKTMKFYTALDIKDYNFHSYFQKDSSDVKAYAEVPFTVKVKSERGVKNALKLINALAEKENLVKKRNFDKIDTIKLINDLNV